MEAIVEILIYLVFFGGMYLVQWCIRHKQATFTIMIVLLMVLDVFVWLKLHGKL
jgi:hypothetical protein